MVGFFFWKTSNIVHSKEMTLMITKMDPILFLNLFAPLWGWLVLQIHLVESTGITRLNVAIMQIFLCVSTRSDTMIHLYWNMRTSKTYQVALYYALLPHLAALSIITQKVWDANWCTVLNIYIMTKQNCNQLLIGSLPRQPIEGSRYV